MKKEMIDLRNRNIVALLRDKKRNLALAGAKVSKTELVETVMSAQPWAHYVDFDYASRMMHRLWQKGPEALGCRGLALRKWLDLAEQVKDVMASTKLSNVNSALTYVLNFRRPPRFYISPRTIDELIRRCA